MAFALTVAKLEEAMRQPGCPVCRISRAAAERGIDAFLWENVNDIPTRQPIIDAYGFCGEHTRLLVAIEMSNSGPVLGVNIIYEHLGRLVSGELKRASLTQKMAGWLRRAASRGLLTPKKRCPACITVEETARNQLAVLFEELQAEHEGMSSAYRGSNGLCLDHLRQGLELYAGQHTRGAAWLVEETTLRLERQSECMREYIRKNNWEYRAEKITPEEAAAWRKTLTFFTGLPGERFTFTKEEF